MCDYLERTKHALTLNIMFGNGIRDTSSNPERGSSCFDFRFNVIQAMDKQWVKLGSLALKDHSEFKTTVLH